MSPAASQALSFGSLAAYEDGHRLAESSGGSVYNSGTGIAEYIRFRDQYVDGDGAYGVASHQARQWGCNPGTQICYYAWRGVYVDETNRFGTASGWQVHTLSESGHGAVDWKTRPQVCVDQGFEPDACGTGTYLNP